MKAVIHKTGAIGEVLGIERRDDGIEYVYFESGLCKPISEVGFLYPYEKYMEDRPDWQAFRREAAKDILAGMMAHQRITYGSNYATLAKYAISYADELIRLLKQE